MAADQQPRVKDGTIIRTGETKKRQFVIAMMMASPATTTTTTAIIKVNATVEAFAVGFVNEETLFIAPMLYNHKRNKILNIELSVIL